MSPPEPSEIVTNNQRHAKVLELKEMGRTNTEVAEEVGVSLATVKRDNRLIAEKVKAAVPKVTVLAGKQHAAKRPPEPDGSLLRLPLGWLLFHWLRRLVKPDAQP